MGKYPHGPGQAEKAPGERWGKPQFRINDRCGPVDVHRHMTALRVLDPPLERLRRGQVTARHGAVRHRPLNRLLQGGRPRVYGMKPMTEAGHVLSTRGAKGIQHPGRRRIRVLAPVHPCDDVVVQGRRLL